ncbi:unnamed protein product [Dovyalis caffra]|uniref:Uncharacterized protein n=1 Tax=Dovyalis caffra TaxID=77055 RepID=A0AAV1SMD0_9ROSI|nr:unnamed protein product [Dovyalis caffra]
MEENLDDFDDSSGSGGNRPATKGHLEANQILAAYQASSRSAMIPPGFCKRLNKTVKAMRDHEIGNGTRHKWMKQYTGIGHRSTNHSVLCRA